MHGGEAAGPGSGEIATSDDVTLSVSACGRPRTQCPKNASRLPVAPQGHALLEKPAQPSLRSLKQVQCISWANTHLVHLTICCTGISAATL